MKAILLIVALALVGCDSYANTRFDGSTGSAPYAEKNQDDLWIVYEQHVHKSCAETYPRSGYSSSALTRQSNKANQCINDQLNQDGFVQWQKVYGYGQYK